MAICNVCYERRAKCLLVLARQTVPVFKRLSRNLIREICVYFGAFLVLPCITKGTLSLYNLRGRLVQTSQLSVCCAPHSVICFSEITALYIVCAESSCVLHLDLSTMAEKSLPQMLCFRSFPGAVYWSTTLYVFGGTDTRLNEKYPVSKGRYRYEWIATARSTYKYILQTPCRLRDDIYLSGGEKALGDVELYNAKQDRFTLIKGVLSYYLERAVLIVTEREFVWLSSEGKIVHRDQEQFHVTVRMQAFPKKVAPWGCTQLLEDSKLYWAKEGTGVFYYDLLRDEVCKLG